ncbi:malto-oligosyltrehalose trehalohydrolase [Kutzneria albida]|uniref:Malto-oligosyltrehalose trehalohydrolase n=1 Tax=Kutzneria albida DSM 43870 TaxID=1449976 RepID=W5WGM6_9PSEU|nr:malto-oligosyltrehalose trehalohydrolase [Kutzneria albida]AHH99731.1 malto-oligosyltrehalose trehalohydrolase-like protein [Kutzneria albida DSM 43870]
MTEFSVWAPERDRVRVQIGRTSHELRSTEDGWWRVDVPGTGPGTDYAFLLDDSDEALPDPRSLWQPDGVHGPSRVYEHGAFEWTDSAWTGRALPGGVVYELHIGTFTEGGTFDSAIERLDHLVELGVDFVEVLPVNAFDGVHGWGYDGVLWYAAHDPYGGPDGFKRFVDACHARGLAVLLDVVYNHLGPSGAYLDRFGPYFAGQTIWGPTLNLDGPRSDEVRRYAIDNAVSWLRDFHVDGLRLDAVHALSDRRAIHLLEELASEVDSLAAHLRRPLSLIAESDLNDPRLITPREAGGYGLHAQWSDDLHHCLHATLTGERQGYYGDFGSLPALAATLRSAFFHAGTWSSFRGRTHGRQVDTLTTSGHRFLAYLQNHDQIGNRATGDRLSATLSPGLLACGAALVLCSPYTPMIFMGEEWAARTPWQFFASFPDPELAEAVRTGRGAEFAEHGWDAQDVPDPMDPDTVRRSRLDWSEQREPSNARTLAVYRELIALRRAHPELTDPRLDRLRVEFDESARWIVLHRGELRLACNLGAQPAALPLTGEVLFSSGPGVLAEEDSLHVPAETAVLLRLRSGSGSGDAGRR